LNRRRLLEAIGIMGNVQAANDSEIELRLADGGYTPLEVKRLMAFVPLAFGRPILEQLGVSHFVESVSAKDRNGKWIQVPLASQDVYQAALTLAREHLRVGVMDHELFRYWRFDVANSMRPARLSTRVPTLKAQPSRRHCSGFRPRISLLKHGFID